jgi:uncharacterized protein
VAGTGESAASGPVFFSSGANRLEGILEWPAEASVAPAGRALGGHPVERSPVEADRTAGVVIAHPHPLYGGTMAQPLVYRVAEACRDRRMTTLRFNFRGVGKSGGTYSGSDEFRDVEAAVAYLRTQLPRGLTNALARSQIITPASSVLGSEADEDAAHDLSPVALVGYSFGSQMASAAAASSSVQALALIALVVSTEHTPALVLERLADFRGPVLAVCGEFDDVAPPREVEQVLRSLGLDFRITVVPRTGHFFEGLHREVGAMVAGFLENLL